MILALAFGLGALFIYVGSHLAVGSHNVNTTFTLLFGSIFDAGPSIIPVMVAIGLACLTALAALYRPLMFASISPETAAARGVPVRLLNVLFLVVVGVAAAVTVPVAGTLLIFSLMVGPAAAAARLTRTPVTALLVSVAFGLAATWLGIGLAFATGWPVGFFITAIVTVFYVVTRFAPMPHDALSCLTTPRSLC